MICTGCAEAAEYNRYEFDRLVQPGEEWYDPDDFMVEHPEACGCPCQHEDPVQWEKQFSVPQP